MVIGDLNWLIGNRVKRRVTRMFGIDRENKNGKKIVDFVAKRDMLVTSILFSTGLHTSTWGVL